jgi:alpha-L-fucosidase
VQNGDPGCDASNWPGPAGSSNPLSFNPTALNISQWADSMEALGVTEAVMTAKHGCGFFLWPTNVTLPDGRRYPYAVNESLNVVQMFADTMQARGIGHGYYWSLTNSYFMNVASFVVQPPSTLLPGMANITQEDYYRIAIESLRELWSSFGNLTEIWADGGYPMELQSNLTEMLRTLQPGALVLNGEGVAASPGRWSGTEGDVPPGWPNSYSTTCCNISGNDPAHACEGPGCSPDDPSGFALYAPSSTDYTLQAGDVWFWEEGTPLRTIDELVSTYHATVGANAVLELDFAIDRTGNVAPAHAALYKAFGEWIRSCYGTPLAAASLPPGALTVTVPLGGGGAGGVTMDRVVLQEGLEVGVYGQCVTQYTLEVLVDGAEWQPFGQSGARLIGNKRIELNSPSPGQTGPAINATAVRFNVTGSLCAPVVNVSVFAPGPCVPVPPPPPPPLSRVRFLFPDGRCLCTNTTYPCAGSPTGSCPLFLGDCADPGAVWDDAANGHTLTSLGTTTTNVVNVDCNDCSQHAIAKIVGGSPADLHFSGGQLLYTCAGAPPAGGFCLSGGLEGGPAAPCDPSEPYLPTQVQVEPCSDPSTQGWVRAPL